MTRLVFTAAAVLVAAAIASASVLRLAQAQTPGATPPPPAPAAQPAPPPAAAPAATPAAARQSDAEIVFTLIRSTLVAVHQANVTGNYTVLRDLGAPGFRDKNTAADLARIFTPIRDAKIDLGAAVLLDPQLSRAAVNDQKMLNVAGTLATKPEPVSFELLFQAIEGSWRIFGIAVLPVQQGATPATPASAPAAAAKPAARKPASPKPAAAKPQQRPQTLAPQ